MSCFSPQDLFLEGQKESTGNILNICLLSGCFLSAAKFSSGSIQALDELLPEIPVTWVVDSTRTDSVPQQVVSRRENRWSGVMKVSICNCERTAPSCWTRGGLF